MRTSILVCALLALSPLVAAEESPAAPAVLFHEPIQLMAGGEPIAVESPGFACPTLSDVDGDGKRDLVVGQFKDGKMTVYRNIGTDKAPVFAKGEWIRTGDKPAIVPGVW